MSFQYFLKFGKTHLNIYVISYAVPNLYTNKTKGAIYISYEPVGLTVHPSPERSRVG